MLPQILIGSGILFLYLVLFHSYCNRVDSYSVACVQCSQCQAGFHFFMNIFSTLPCDIVEAKICVVRRPLADCPEFPTSLPQELNTHMTPSSTVPNSSCLACPMSNNTSQHKFYKSGTMHEQYLVFLPPPLNTLAPAFENLPHRKMMCSVMGSAQMKLVSRSSI